MFTLNVTNQDDKYYITDSFDNTCEEIDIHLLKTLQGILSLNIPDNIITELFPRLVFVMDYLSDSGTYAVLDTSTMSIESNDLGELRGIKNKISTVFGLSRRNSHTRNSVYFNYDYDEKLCRNSNVALNIKRLRDKVIFYGDFQKDNILTKLVIELNENSGYHTDMSDNKISKLLRTAISNGDCQTFRFNGKTILYRYDCDGYILVNNILLNGSTDDDVLYTMLNSVPVDIDGKVHLNGDYDELVLDRDTVLDGNVSVNNLTVKSVNINFNYGHMNVAHLYTDSVRLLRKFITNAFRDNEILNLYLTSSEFKKGVKNDLMGLFCIRQLKLKIHLTDVFELKLSDLIDLNILDDYSDSIELFKSKLREIRDVYYSADVYRYKLIANNYITVYALTKLVGLSDEDFDRLYNYLGNYTYLEEDSHCYLKRLLTKVDSVKTLVDNNIKGINKRSKEVLYVRV